MARIDKKRDLQRDLDFHTITLYTKNINRLTYFSDRNEMRCDAAVLLS